MKKLSLLILMIGLLAVDNSAQNNDGDFRENLLFGLKIGANYSNVYDSEGEEFKTDPRLGLVFGAFLAVPVGKYLGIQPEVLFSQKGFNATGRILGSPYKFTRTTSYIDVPLLIQFKPGKFITLMAGPQYSFLIKQSDVFESASLSFEQEQEFENDNIRKNTFCFIGGFDINYNHFVFGARVGWDILNNNGDGTTTTPRYKNFWYQATIGLRLYN
ncbi:MAG: porin family protein [Bacteroidales bacterium]